MTPQEILEFYNHNKTKLIPILLQKGIQVWNPILFFENHLSVLGAHKENTPIYNLSFQRLVRYIEYYNEINELKNRPETQMLIGKFNINTSKKVFINTKGDCIKTLPSQTIKIGSYIMGS